MAKFSLQDVDIVLGSLEPTVGSIGGFCCTAGHVIRSLRFLAPGYTFAAAAPAVAAVWAAEILEGQVIPNLPFQ